MPRCLRCGSVIPVEELEEHHYGCPNHGVAWGEPADPITLDRDEPLVPTTKLELAIRAYRTARSERSGVYRDRPGSEARSPTSRPGKTRLLGALYRKITSFGGASA